MAHAARVHVRERLDDLSEVPPHVSHAHAAPRAPQPRELPLQVALARLKPHVEVLMVLEGEREPHDAWVVKRVHHIALELHVSLLVLANQVTLRSALHVGWARHARRARLQSAPRCAQVAEAGALRSRRRTARARTAA